MRRPSVAGVSLVALMVIVFAVLGLRLEGENSRLSDVIAGLAREKEEREVAVALREGEMALVRFERAASGRVEAVELFAFKPIRPLEFATHRPSKDRLATTFKWVVKLTKPPLLFEGCRESYDLFFNASWLRPKEGAPAVLTGSMAVGPPVTDGRCGQK